MKALLSSLGRKRLVTLTLLGGFVLILGGYNFLSLAPSAVQMQRNLNTSRGQLSTTGEDLRRIEEEMDGFEERHARYETLKQAGFFGTQDRVMARQRFEAVRQQSGVLRARYEIKPADVRQDELATEIGQVILSSRLVMHVEALDDRDVYKFIQGVMDELPGAVTIDKINLERVEEITPTMLTDIREDRAPALVTADIEANWQTLTPKETLPDSSLEWAQ